MTSKFKREPESGLIFENIEIDNKYENDLGYWCDKYNY